MAATRKRIFSFPKVYNTYFVAIIATMGGMLFGFDISSMSAIIGTDQYLEYFDNPHGVVQGATGSALAAGSVVGAISSGPLSDWQGRRAAIWWSCLWWIAGTGIQVGCTSWGMLIAGRFFNGICVGVTSAQVPVYLAEISKAEKRGSIIVIQQLAIEWGIWLAKKDRVDEAIHNLAHIQADGDIKDPRVVAEFEEIATTLAAERAAAPGWRKFVYNNMWRRTFAGFSVQAWQQLSGANVMTYYIVYVFGMAGLTGDINRISSGVQYALFIVFSTATFFFVDKVGRRPLLIFGAVGMAICHFVVGGTLGSYSVPAPEGVDGNLNVIIRVSGKPSHVVIAFSYLLVIVYALTLAPIAWVYAAEVWSLETRASGMGIVAVGNWLFNFALGFFIPPGFRNITYNMFIVFGALCLGAAVQAFFTYPETGGKTLEEIEILFSKDGPKPWKTKVGQSRIQEEIDNAAKAQSRGLSMSEYNEEKTKMMQAGGLGNANGKDGQYEVEQV